MQSKTEKALLCQKAVKLLKRGVNNLANGIITKVAGPLVIAEGMRDANMFDVVRVSKQRLIGEIIEMHGDQASIQVYEETSGLGPGEEVESTGAPLSVELGPGLIGSIYDGIQRPLNEIMKKVGNNLTRGVEVPSLDHEKKWHFLPTVKKGDEVSAGDVLGAMNAADGVKTLVIAILVGIVVVVVIFLMGMWFGSWRARRK